MAALFQFSPFTARVHIRRYKACTLHALIQLISCSRNADCYLLIYRVNTSRIIYKTWPACNPPIYHHVNTHLPQQTQTAQVVKNARLCFRQSIQYQEKFLVTKLNAIYPAMRLMSIRRQFPCIPSNLASAASLGVI